ncbi:MAG: bifunctional phosphoribosyl-AMP cyclohydrolase/phosphoribosyl-ATP diphosphatase HisIE [Deltaproteobacteria bacterium]|nr:MAG: bifunctional phosphoribosyl-AMP cyclohydrolase/phosphoribosyl-ATP diphosphatase HisIE [Deltaproteobacteria bacterium]
MTPDDVKWDEQGLAPAIVQDAVSGEVLMLAWMTRESLQRTLETRLATFWSRSRRELWTKGATSGNTQAVRAVALDCDQDAILLRVVPAGPACHTGARSCFVAGDALLDGPPSPGETLAALERVLRSRRREAPEGSYSAKLFADEALRHKKVGEEAAELVVASLRGKPDEIAHEAADLFYHALVLLQAHGITLPDVTAVLRSREGKRRG